LTNVEVNDELAATVVNADVPALYPPIDAKSFTDGFLDFRARN